MVKVKSLHDHKGGTRKTELRCMISDNEPWYPGIVTRNGKQHSPVNLVHLAGNGSIRADQDDVGK